MDAFECPFSAHARNQPNAPALQQGREIWTYRNCQEWINGLGASFRKLGISSGHCVAIYPELSLLTPLLFFALFRMNVTVFPLHHHLPVAAIKKQLAVVRPSLLLHPDNSGESVSFVKTLSLSNLKRKTNPISHSLQSFLEKKTLSNLSRNIGHDKKAQNRRALPRQPLL